MQVNLETDRKLVRKILLALFALVFLIYGNSMRNGYSMDDRYVTVTNPQNPDNPRVAKGIRGIPEIFSSPYIQSETQNFEYRPLPMATFALEYQFFGSNAGVNHFFNVLLYAITCGLLFLVLLELFKGYNLALPVLVVSLFAVHPIHTEVVNNLKII
jgi:protein O-mannosyl-transferase